LLLLHLTAACTAAAAANGKRENCQHNEKPDRRLQEAKETIKVQLFVELLHQQVLFVRENFPVDDLVGQAVASGVAHDALDTGWIALVNVVECRFEQHIKSFVEGILDETGPRIGSDGGGEECDENQLAVSGEIFKEFLKRILRFLRFLEFSKYFNSLKEFFKIFKWIFSGF
jgi:hypothetical protein